MQQKMIASLALAVTLVAAPFAALAQQTPVGAWTTIDDATNKPKSVVEIYEAPNGSLAGKVLQVLQSDKGPNPKCTECDGDRKNQPVEGMVILWGIAGTGKEWKGGKILDPATGKVYSAKMTLSDDGKALEVRGFMGFSLLGKTQTWQRR